MTLPPWQLTGFPLGSVIVKVTCGSADRRGTTRRRLGHRHRREATGAPSVDANPPASLNDVVVSDLSMNMDFALVLLE